MFELVRTSSAVVPADAGTQTRLVDSGVGLDLTSSKVWTPTFVGATAVG